MKPTVGRIVHFFTDVPGEQRHGGGVGPYAAIITQVNGGTHVNLTVFSPTPSASDMKAVGVPFNDATEKRHWTWPSREE